MVPSSGLLRAYLPPMDLSRYWTLAQYWSHQYKHVGKGNLESRPDMGTPLCTPDPHHPGYKVLLLR